VAGRFSYRDLAEAIVDPSKVVSDQYRGSVVETAAGQVITGRILGEEEGKLVVLTDPEDITKIAKIDRSEVEQIAPSQVSLMPKGLLDVLNESEVLDVLAFLMSRGNPEDPVFQKSPE
jgi:putative heme-binding domain-containing protein